MNANPKNSPVVLITGALTGIARATAIAFAKSGAKVVVSGRHDKEGAALETELRATGAEAKFVRADVRHDEAVRALIDDAVKTFGRLDIAVNAAGTEGKPGPAVDQTAESYAATFDTNVLGTVLSMKHELRVMQEQKSGSIVNISSTFGHEGGAGASISLNNAPKYKIDAEAGYTFHADRLDITPRVQSTWIDRVYFTEFNRPNNSQPARNELNFFLNVIAPATGWSASAFVRNATNKTYVVSSFDISLHQHENVGQYGNPRTFGLQVTKTF